MGKKIILDSTLTAIANAIRAKTGKENAMFPSEMPDEIASIKTGNPGLYELATGTATGDIDITAPDLPGLGIVFGRSNVFMNAIDTLTIRGAKVLGCYENGTGGFNVYSSGIEEIHLPDVEDLNITRAFSNVSSTWHLLNTFDAPKLKKIGKNWFNYASHLADITLTSVEEIAQSAFVRCAFATADMPNLTSIAATAFQNCASLTALILRGNTVCTMANTNALASTPISSGTGYIYVPRALVDTYKAATNWSTYASQFRAIEDYTSDGTITGTFVNPS